MRTPKELKNLIESRHRVTLTRDERENILSITEKKFGKKAIVFNKSCGECWHRAINNIVKDEHKPAPRTVINNEQMVKPLTELNMGELRDIISNKGHEYSSKFKTELINYIQINNLYYGK